MTPTPTQIQTGTANRPILEVKALQTHFFLESGVVRAVDGVTFSLMRGQTLGIVGESGCGKSITSMSIMRLIQSRPGKIVGGEINLHMKQTDQVVDIVKLDPNGSKMRSIRGAEIAMIFQEPMTSLNPLRTIGDGDAEESAEGRAGAARQAVSTSTQRRHAAARYDRPCPFLQPVDPDRR